MEFAIYTNKVPFEDELNGDQKSTFCNGYKTVLLKKDFTLWRFVSLKSDNPFGAYWIDPPTMRDIMEFFHMTGNFVEEYKKEWIRDKLALLSPTINEKWSLVNWRVKIGLIQEVIAHVGLADTQQRWVKATSDLFSGTPRTVEKLIETRRGMTFQYVIPRLDRISRSNEFARIEHFVHI